MTRPARRGTDRRDSASRLVVFIAALAAFTALASVTVGCRRRPHVKGTVAVDDVLKRWNNDGFDTEGVENLDASPWSAGACSRGPVAGLDVLLCEYAADDELARGDQQMRRDFAQQQVGTGLVVRTSRTLLAIVDNRDVDPSGQTIAKLASAFRTLQ